MILGRKVLLVALIAASAAVSTEALRGSANQVQAQERHLTKGETEKTKNKEKNTVSKEKNTVSKEKETNGTTVVAKKPPAAPGKGFTSSVPPAGTVTNQPPPENTQQTAQGGYSAVPTQPAATAQPPATMEPPATSEPPATTETTQSGGFNPAAYFGIGTQGFGPQSQNIPPNAVPPQGVPPQGVPPQGVPPPGPWPQPNMPQGVPPQGVPPQEIPPQGIPFQGVPSQGVPPPGVFPPTGVAPGQGMTAPENQGPHCIDSNDPNCFKLPTFTSTTPAVNVKNTNPTQGTTGGNSEYRPPPETFSNPHSNPTTTSTNPTTTSTNPAPKQEETAKQAKNTGKNSGQTNSACDPSDPHCFELPNFTGMKPEDITFNTSTTSTIHGFITTGNGGVVKAEYASGGSTTTATVLAPTTTVLTPTTTVQPAPVQPAPVQPAPVQPTPLVPTTTWGSDDTGNIEGAVLATLPPPVYLTESPTAAPSSERNTWWTSNNGVATNIASVVTAEYSAAPSQVGACGALITAAVAGAIALL